MLSRRLKLVPGIGLLLLAAMAACSSGSDKGNGDPGDSSSGGAGAMSGGQSSSGGAVGSGGVTGGGGAPSTGGGLSTGGDLGLGGEGATGGSDGSGGGDGSGGSSPTGARFPFPQNAPSEHCVFPSTYDNADVRAAYELWKETVVTSEGASGHLRVRKPDSGTEIDSTVSEGIGYGLLLAVYFDDQTVFDEIWKYEQLYLNENGLMHWEINAAGQVIGSGAALDGDEDMAWALIMADR